MRGAIITEEAVRDLLACYTEFSQNGDAAGIACLYSENATIRQPDGITTTSGQRAILSSLQRAFAKPDRVPDTVDTVFITVADGGQSAVAKEFWKNEGDGSKGEAYVYFRLVRNEVKIADEWLIPT